MPSANFLAIAVASVVLSASIAAAQAPAGSTPRSTANSLENLKARFVSPPASAKPMVRWWWFGVAVEKAEILR